MISVTLILVVVASVSTNFVKHRTRFYWIIKRKPKIHVLTRGGSCNFQPCFRGGSVIFVPKGGVRSCVFYQPHFQMLRPTPSPPPILFDQSLRAFFPQGQSKPSVTMRCPYWAGVRIGAGFDCKINKRNFDITKPLYGEHILPVLQVFVQLFVISRFKC